MKNEFKRFNLERFALLTIFFEFMGAAGLLIGLYFNPILIISSGGLSLLMLLGVMVRIKIKDSIWVTLPAVLFMVLNFYIFISAIENIKV
jgi:hypothetical protein